MLYILYNKASGGDAIPVELFQILKDDAAFVDDAAPVTIYKAPCLFNLYAEYIMRNAGLDEAQVGIKIAGRSLRYADDTTLMAESEEELKSLLMNVKRRVKKLA